MIHSINDTKTKEYISLVAKINEGAQRRVFSVTFGCQQNERDSEVALGYASAMGYTPTENPDDADLIIVNTCAIRQHAEEKALSMLGRFKALKRAKPDLIIGVIGCMAAEKHRAELIKRDFHYVSFTLEPNMLHRIPELVYRKLEDGKRSFVFGTDEGDIYENAPSVRRDGHRAWVSIMYGCNNFCSYCIVPYVRGRERSRDSSDVLAECRELISFGVKEITLLGQNVNSYKSDLNFAELLSAVAEIEGDFIIRFMTSHPKDTTNDLISVMTKYTPKIAPYFHLPLQSGSTTVLSAMNRTYTKEKYLEVAMKLRESVPNIALSTDVIIGFPGETEEDFVELCEFVKEQKFARAGVFTYSREEGTPAYDFDGQIDEQVKQDRMDILMRTQLLISDEANKAKKGSVVNVLCEDYDPVSEYHFGRSEADAPEIDGKVFFKSDTRIAPGSFVKVKVRRVTDYDLCGFAMKQ